MKSKSRDFLFAEMHMSMNDVNTLSTDQPSLCGLTL